MMADRMQGICPSKEHTMRRLTAVILGTLLSVAVAAPGNASDTQRWIVALHGHGQLAGILKAAAARNCELANQTERFVSFDCPQGLKPVAQASLAMRYHMHDNTTNALIGAADVHGGVAAGSFNGSGVRVAVVDSGFDTNHPAIAAALDTCVNTTGDGNACEDTSGHGTAVSAIIAGILSGSGSVSPDSVAPGASIISVKVFPDDGSAIFSDDVAVALLAALAQGADVINLSLGGGRATASHCDAAGDPAVDVINTEAAAADVPVVVSSGNDGFQDGIGYPACASKAIAVGATYQRNEGGLNWSTCIDRRTRTDNVTCFSNSGSALDVVAPGAFIWTAAMGGGYAWFHGTSASAPVVSGAAALLKDQNPTLTEDEIRDALRDTALELGNGKNKTRNGEGRIDSVLASGAVDSLAGCTADSECDDANACNGLETCDLGTGACADGTPLPSCDDGVFCNGTETCNPADGTCSAGSALTCNDGSSCTADSCNEIDGCLNVENGTCRSCVPASKGRCNCDGKCTKKEAAYGACGDCQ
jgi:hypothetical protein